jgi:hypothetical protein
MNEATQTKKASWKLDVDTGITSVVLPSGISGTYDLTTVFSADWTELTVVSQYLVYYGFKQKAADATAMPSDAKLTDQERLDVFEAVLSRLAAGDWNAKVTSVDRAAAALRRCDDEAEMRVLEKVLPYVTAEDVASELVRREAE